MTRFYQEGRNSDQITEQNWWEEFDMADFAKDYADNEDDLDRDKIKSFIQCLITSIKQEEREKSIRGFSQWWAKNQTKEKERYIQIEAHQEAMRMANIYIQSLTEEDIKNSK